MYAYIKGKLIEVTPEYAVVDVGGVGYKLNIPISLYAKGLNVQEEILLFTCYVVREDAIRLFGFIEDKERELFERLINVSGIGVKTALNLLGHLSFEELHLAIQTEDTATLSRVPGIGKKTAERIIVELADRIAKWAPLVRDKVCSLSSTSADALSALINLGYQATLAQKAIHKVIDKEGGTLSLGKLISAALKEI